jgi:hypothetical protein
MSIRRLVAALALASLVGPAGAAPQMYKCVEGGRTVYQQQACPVTPQADAPAASAPKPAASAASDAASAAARKLRRPLPPASSVPATPR